MATWPEAPVRRECLAGEPEQMKKKMMTKMKMMRGCEVARRGNKQGWGRRV